MAKGDLIDGLRYNLLYRFKLNCNYCDYYLELLINRTKLKKHMMKKHIEEYVKIVSQEESNKDYYFQFTLNCNYCDFEIYFNEGNKSAYEHYLKEHSQKHNEHQAQIFGSIINCKHKELRKRTCINCGYVV